MEKNKAAKKAVIQNARDTEKRIHAERSSAAALVETTRRLYHSSLARERQAVDTIVTVKAAQVKKLRTDLSNSHRSQIEASEAASIELKTTKEEMRKASVTASNALESSQHDTKRKIEQATTTASIELKSSERDMKRKHSSEVLGKKSELTSTKRAHKAEMASSEKIASDATKEANESRKKALTSEKALEQFKARLAETLDTCAKLRDTLEELKLQQDRLDEELIEQREEYEELENDRCETIDELEMNLGDAVEKIHVSSTLNCMSHLFIHLHIGCCLNFQHSGTTSQYCDEGAKQASLQKEGM